jgi:hypothetical protein
MPRIGQKPQPGTLRAQESKLLFSITVAGLKTIPTQDIVFVGILVRFFFLLIW